jgi:hypothetical protein
MFHSPLFFLIIIFHRHALQKKNGMEGLTKDVVRCFENAVYLHKRMVDAGYSAMLNKFVLWPPSLLC